MEIIQHNDRIIALIFRPDADQHASSFFTPPGLSMQVGFLQYPSGASIRAHSHPSNEARTMTGVAEIAIVQSGSIEVDLFSPEETAISTHILRAGEAIVLLSGGHAFRMLEDTTLYLIKPGPHTGAGDKKYL